MADTRRTYAALATLLADNTSGAISAQDLRDFLESMTVHVAAAAPTASDDETAGFDVGHVWKDTSSTPDSFHMCMSASTSAAVWVQIYPASAAWGSISGTLADQTDLQAALDAKAASSHTHTLSDITDAGTAAAAATGDFATAAQGALADSAVQPGDPVSINTQTGTSYTLVLGDAGKLVTCENAGAITLTIPTNASVAFDTGAVIAVAQLGAGTVTIQGDTGVTVNGTSAGSEALSAQYATASLTKLASDTWLVSGSLA